MHAGVRVYVSVLWSTVVFSSLCYVRVWYPPLMTAQLVLCCVVSGCQRMSITFTHWFTFPFCPLGVFYVFLFFCWTLYYKYSFLSFLYSHHINFHFHFHNSRLHYTVCLVISCLLCFPFQSLYISSYRCMCSVLCTCLWQQMPAVVSMWRDAYFVSVSVNA